MNGPGFVFHFYLSTCTVCIYTVDFSVLLSPHSPAVGFHSLQIHCSFMYLLNILKEILHFSVGFIFVIFNIVCLLKIYF